MGVTLLLQKKIFNLVLLTKNLFFFCKILIFFLYYSKYLANHSTISFNSFRRKKFRILVLFPPAMIRTDKTLYTCPTWDALLVVWRKYNQSGTPCINHLIKIFHLLIHYIYLGTPFSYIYNLVTTIADFSTLTANQLVNINRARCSKISKTFSGHYRTCTLPKNNFHLLQRWVSVCFYLILYIPIARYYTRTNI